MANTCATCHGTGRWYTIRGREPCPACVPLIETAPSPLRTADDELRKARDALHAAAARSRDPARIRAIDGIIGQVSMLLPPPVVVTTPSAADDSFLMKRFTETI